MSSRLIEVFVPDARRDQAEALLTDYPDVEAWYEPLFGQKLWIRIFVDQVNVEAIVDQFAQRFDEVEGFRLLILDVEATLPYLEIEAASASASLTDKLTPDIEDALDPRSTRVNRIEIYDQVAEGSQLSWVQIVMVLLSTAIAAIGILRDNQAVVIGAMVIAPLLKPNMALAVATTMGDTSFALRTLWTGLVGILIALGFSVVIGVAVPVNLESSEIASRLQVDWLDGVLAFASGAAGAIALTSEERSGLVGVMVSVALLPPLVVLGLLLGGGHWALALGAGLLVATNLICLNLAAVTTLLVQDLRPQQRQDVPKAEKVTETAYGIWIGLLIGLVGIVMISRLNSIGPY
jgi:uncharacterized hydrophobic protein (TIGR00341 family)